jgi:hypothetical protein
MQHSPKQTTMNKIKEISQVKKTPTTNKERVSGKTEITLMEI